MAAEEPREAIELRETEVEDWPAIAALLGRGPADGRRLRHQVQQAYDPWFSFVAELPADAPTTGSEIAGASGTPVVGTVVAGVPRAQETQSGDPERQDEGRILWLGVAESHRRRRLGRRLLDLALEELRYRRLRRVTLLVDGTQTEALALFRQAGFSREGQTLNLLLPPERVAALAIGSAADGADRPRVSMGIRALALDDVPLLSGLLIQLAVERAQEPHDELEALSPAQVEDWLQRPGTVGFAAWEAADPHTPVGLAWASRRQDDAALRFIGVGEDHRRRGLGTALLVALGEGVARPPDDCGVLSGDRTDAARYRPLRATLRQPGTEQAFFRARGFEAEQVTYAMAREL